MKTRLDLETSVNPTLDLVLIKCEDVTVIGRNPPHAPHTTLPQLSVCPIALITLPTHPVPPGGCGWCSSGLRLVFGPLVSATRVRILAKAICPVGDVAFFH